MAILIRPVREQFEHDRVIRELEFKLRRRYEVEANVGDDQRVPVKSGGRAEFPDLVLSTPTSGKKPHAIVEVETAESVNRLEAMHEWVRFSKVRAQFHLYVPAVAIDATLRLCKEHRVSPNEVWAFVPYGDQYRFTQVLPTPGKLEPDMDLEEARAERRAAQAEHAAEIAAEEVAAEAPPSLAKTAPKRQPRTTGRKVVSKVVAAVSTRASAHKAAAAFSAAQAAKAAKAAATKATTTKPTAKVVTPSKPVGRAKPKPVVRAVKGASKVAPTPARTTGTTPVKKAAAPVRARASASAKGARAKAVVKPAPPTPAKPKAKAKAKAGTTAKTTAKTTARTAATTASARKRSRPSVTVKAGAPKKAPAQKARPKSASRTQKRR